MKDLFTSEWRRFRRLTLIVALGHALALLFLSRITNLLQRGYPDHSLMLTLYLALGLTLALVQIGSYRKPSRWLWLIHRPLRPQRIFAALAGSALAMLTLAIFLPLLGFVVATDALTTQVVDGRHYVAAFHALAFTMMAWLAGAHACASRHRTAIAVLTVPLLLALHLVSVWSLLLPVLVGLAWLTWIAMHGFRADRDAPIARPSVLLLTALPLQLAFFLLVFHLSKATIDVVDLMRPRYPSQTVLSTDPDIEQLQRSFAQNALIQGLEGSRDARAAAWREQLPLLDVAELVPDIERFPVRHQISNLDAPWWDETRNVEWTFSHDRMLFQGRDPKTGADQGWWGATGTEAPKTFETVPAFGLTPNTLYAIDETTQRQHELVRLPAGEGFVGRPQRALDRLLVLTNQRVLAYRSDRQAASPSAPPSLDWQLAYRPGERAPAVTVAELLDGWLVLLFYFPGQEFAGFEDLAPSWRQVVHIDAEGQATVVAERHDIRGHNVSIGSAPAIPKASWWLSPPLYLLGRWPGTVLDSGLTQPAPLAPLPAVRAFYPLAAGLMLLSLALGAWWLRGTRISAARRGFWLASCALLSLPAVLSLMCLEPRAPRA